METKIDAYIKQYGGKAGVLLYLRDLGSFEEYLVKDSQHFGSKIEIPKIIESVDFLEKRKIVRGTTLEDFSGFVDIIATYYNFDSLYADKIISQIKESAISDEVISYAKYEGFDSYTGQDVGVFIQDYIEGVKGSMIEHPGAKDMYLIEHESKGSRFVSQGVLTMTGTFDSDGKDAREDSSFSNEVYRPKELVALYQKVRESGAVPDEYSFQIEFVISEENIYLVQVRLFRKFYESQDYGVFFGRTETEKYHSFGVTPEDGISIPLVKDSIWETEDKEVFYAIDNSIGGSQNPRMPMPLYFQPKNMKVYTNKMNSGNFLTHGHYRWLQKVPIAMFMSGNGYIFEDFNDYDVMIVKSDGIRGAFKLA